MNNEEVLASLANTLMQTRAELDAIRTIMIGALAVLAKNPEMQADLASSIRSAIDSDSAISLNTQMPDALLDQRMEWMKRLTPQPIQHIVWNQ